MTEEDTMNTADTGTIEEVKSVLGATLGVEDRAGEFDASTPLLGGLPELDSLAAVELIAALQTHFWIEIEDDEINAEVFETVGSLAALIDGKLQSEPV
jgi:acyl carrier protein